MKEKNLLGYVRVSSREQNEDRLPKPLPDNFYEVHKAWKNKKLI
ncbi:hypothetical protein AALB51_17465 [Lachnospiraceae bacterium 62-26]